MACVHYSKNVSRPKKSNIRKLENRFLYLGDYLYDIEIEYVRRKLRLRDTSAFDLIHVSYNSDYSKNVVVYLRLIEKYRIVLIPQLEPHYNKKPFYKIRYGVNWLKPDKSIITKYYDTLDVYYNLKIGYKNKYGWRVLKKFQESYISHYYDHFETYSLTY